MATRPFPDENHVHRPGRRRGTCRPVFHAGDVSTFASLNTLFYKIAVTKKTPYPVDNFQECAEVRARGSGWGADANLCPPRKRCSVRRRGYAHQTHPVGHGDLGAEQECEGRGGSAQQAAVRQRRTLLVGRELRSAAEIARGSHHRRRRRSRSPPRRSKRRIYSR